MPEACTAEAYIFQPDAGVLEEPKVNKDELPPWEGAGDLFILVSNRLNHLIKERKHDNIIHSCSWGLSLPENSVCWLVDPLCQHWWGHLASAAAGTVTYFYLAKSGPEPQLYQRMQLTHKTSSRKEADTSITRRCAGHCLKWGNNPRGGERWSGGTHHSQLLRSVGLPESDVHFIGATQNIFTVCRPLDTDDMLHAFGVVNLPTFEK